MSKVIRCLNCGTDNRLPDEGPDRRGVFRCGSCREGISFYAPEGEFAESEEEKVDEDARTFSWILSALCWSASASLAVMFWGWADTYYNVARLLVFAASACGLFLAMHDREHRWPWFFMLGGLMAFYLPLMHVLFVRVAWLMIDCGAVVVLAAAPFYCKVPRKLREKLEMTPEEEMRHADRTV